VHKDTYGNAVTGDVSINDTQSVENCILVCEPPYRIRTGTLNNMIVSVSRHGNVLILPVVDDQNIKRHLQNTNCATSPDHSASIWNVADTKKVDVQISENEVRINC